ncbi:MAG: c-type cytochrome [Verrucomicrobiaceae bacterium]|nr:c-type cytochrome [Verrucomicrobiaceae bacterium]
MRLLALVILPVIALAQESKLRLVRESEAQSPAQERAGFHVPPGFTVHLFASEPMINKPINMAFDARGRLWVSSTVEYPYAAAKDRWADAQGSRVKDSRDAIKILEDTDGDGKADKVTDFADGLNIPTGVLPWHKPEDKDGCIAWSIPNIWYFADTDGDGKCDQRDVLFGPLGYEKDTHGMCSSFRLGLDGWVYATHGFNNTSHLKAKDGSTLDLHSGNVFRFRPDASHVEIYSWGQVNPFGLCWDRYGNLYSADCHSNPITQLIRGAYYPSFGKPHDGLGFGPNMCEHSHGSTGLCGITYIDGGIWGPEWDDHMFLGNCVTSKVNHDKITFTGSTPKANEAPDFITSDDLWFRPVDLQLGPDNALYIADFYNKIIGHYEVPLDHPGRDKERGRIWRVVKDGASGKRSLRHADQSTYPLDWLSAPDARKVRTTAAFYAENPKVEALSSLLLAFDRCDPLDLSLRHQLKLSLREHLKLPGAFASLSDKDNPHIIDIAKAVPTADAAAFLFDEWKAKRLNDSLSGLLGIIARNSSSSLIDESLNEARTLKASEAIAALSAMHNGLLERGALPPPALLVWATELAEAALDSSASHQSHWTHLPHASHPNDSPWCLQERKCADGQMATVISSLDKDKKAPEKLTGILRSKAFAAPAKLSFWICGHDGFPKTEANHKNLVRLMVNDKAVREAFPPRNDVCQHIDWELADLKGQQVQLEVVDGDDGPSFAWLGITRIEPAVVSIESFTTDNEKQKQLRTLAAILRTTAPVGLRDRLAPYLPKPAVAPAPAKLRPELDALIAARRSSFAKAKPDLARGEAVFKANCAVCHTLKGQGGVIGPQLDGVGNRGADRLMEDILDPNRNVDAHFHLHQLRLRDGSTITGFIRGEVGQVTILVDAANNEQRVAKGDITEDTDLPQSLMPPMFGQMIPEAAFHDLIGWMLKN